MQTDPGKVGGYVIQLELVGEVTDWKLGVVPPCSCWQVGGGGERVKVDAVGAGHRHGGQNRLGGFNLPRTKTSFF